MGSGEATLCFPLLLPPSLLSFRRDPPKIDPKNPSFSFFVSPAFRPPVSIFFSSWDFPFALSRSRSKLSLPFGPGLSMELWSTSNRAPSCAFSG